MKMNIYVYIYPLDASNPDEKVIFFEFFEMKLNKFTRSFP